MPNNIFETLNDAAHRLRSSLLLTAASARDSLWMMIMLRNSDEIVAGLHLSKARIDVEELRDACNAFLDAHARTLQSSEPSPTRHVNVIARTPPDSRINLTRFEAEVIEGEA